MRLNKYLAECGVSSRRGADKLIAEGKVSLNGRVVTNLATDVDERKDIVHCDGKKLEHIGTNHIYLMVNKPKGFVTTTKDEKDRKTVLDLLDERYKDKRVFPVGRLDYETEGLLILTTDGDLSFRLTHPKNEIPKTYVAKVNGLVDVAFLQQLRNGVVIDGQKTGKCKARVLDFVDNVSRVEVVITEGRNRQVRKMFFALGREVLFLKRMAIGDLRVGGLSRGGCRELTQKEVYYLKNL